MTINLNKNLISRISALFTLSILPLQWVHAVSIKLYTYDSLKKFITKETSDFAKKNGIDLVIQAKGDGAQVLSQIELETKTGQDSADVVIGIDQNTWARAKLLSQSTSFLRDEGNGKTFFEVHSIEKKLGFDPDFIPFDYGEMTFMADMVELKKLKLDAPKSLNDLVKPAFKKRFILQDPRTSTPGLGFLMFSHSVLSKNAGFKPYWATLKDQWLTMGAGWDQTYGLFLKGESPLVWSYSTSQAYHEKEGDHSGRYKAIVLAEGAPLQVEGMMVVKKSNRDAEQTTALKKLISFWVSPEFQSKIYFGNYMFPVLEERLLTVPVEYKHIERPKQSVLKVPTLDEVQGILGEFKAALN